MLTAISPPKLHFPGVLLLALLGSVAAWGENYPHSELDLTSQPVAPSSSKSASPSNDKPVSPDNAEAVVPQPGMVGRSFRAMESGRDYLSTKYMGMAEGLDNYFTEDTFDEDFTNESYVKLELRDTMFEHGEHESDVRIKAKLDLPNTEKRLKLVFSSDERQDETLEERSRAVSTGQRLSRDGSVTAIEYAPLKEWRRWQRSARLGIRVKIPLDPFARYRLRRYWHWGEFWQGKFEQSFWYYYDKGAGETSEFEVKRALAEDLEFKIWGEVEYKDKDEQFEFIQGYSLVHYLTDDAVAQYRIGFVGASEPNWRANSYFWGLHYRRSLHEDWVYLSCIPEIYYPRDEHWGAEPSITFKLEVYFSD